VLKGYFPFVSGLTDFTKIPFDFISSPEKSAEDHYWIKADTITPVLGIVNRSLQFQPTMSFISIQLNRSLSDFMTTTIRKVRVETEDGGEWIPAKGYYNGENGDVTVQDYTNSLEYHHDTPSNVSSYDYVYIKLPEIELSSSTVANRKLKVTIYYGYYFEEEWCEILSGPLVIDLAKLNTYYDPVRYGMIKGYKYNVYVRFDDFFHIKPFDIPPGKPWKDETIDIKL